MKITWYGTASLLLDTGKEKVLIDPFLGYPDSENRPSLSDFLQTENILATHGHFDHLATIPKIMELSEATVYCTKTPARTLEKKNVDPDHISVVQPGTTLAFNGITVEVLPGRHAHFDSAIIRKTLFNTRILRYMYNLPSLIHGLLSYPEKGETVSFLVHACGKSVLVLGSLGLDDHTVYPAGADLLILPYQGTSCLVEDSVRIIRRIRPKTIMLSHFDDAYPPVTNSIDTRPLKKILAEHFPDIPVVKPVAGKPVTLP